MAAMNFSGENTLKFFLFFCPLFLQIRDTLQRSQVTGGDRFRKEISGRLGIRLSHKGTGRQKKATGAKIIIPTGPIVTLDKINITKKDM